MTRMKIGTHNLHDTTGTATPFADFIGFCEAIPRRVRKQMRRTHRVFVCGQQRDLIIAVRRDVRIRKVVKHWKFAVPGRKLVSPLRGTFWITFERWEPGVGWVREFFLVEHRVNAAFPPFIRGESKWRPFMWRRHTKITQRIIERMETKGRHGAAVGDVNTPRGVDGYPDIAGDEFGDHFDRIFIAGNWWTPRRFRVGRKHGSDHSLLVLDVDTA